MYSFYMGIDPGVNGGVAIIGNRVTLKPMPETESDIWGLLEGVSREYGNNIYCCIEEIRTAAFGRNRGDSIPKLYGSYMGLRMALTGLAINFQAVGSKVWQKYTEIEPKVKGESDNKWKGRLRKVAQKLLPGLPVSEKTADALLIADYCRRLCKGELELSNAKDTGKTKGKTTRGSTTKSSSKTTYRPVYG